MVSKWVQLLRSVRLLRNWHIQLREAFGILRPQSLAFHLRNGWVIHGRQGTIDRCSFNEVWLDRVYDPPSASIPWAASSCIVDIGGHIGSFALYAALHAPSAQILSIEALPQNSALLQRNIEENGLQDRITVVQSAVTDAVGTAQFAVTHSTGGNSLYEYGQTKESITVPTQTLASLWKTYGIEHCDVLKIDCEGAEYAILETADPSLLATVDCMVIEVHAFMREHGKDPSIIRDILHRAGFSVEETSKSVLCATRRPAQEI